eukprot:TRINITY_DN42853_c0_g1_i2.p2 TRINITY_DN42853_c0_g1~~TRINITY_DN42853_c0_g1_i2.p2  ORF type:complete len:126 (+),score=16.75 TRINITY_DN42853_c0_g1_i2:273-650(+)
MGNSRRSVSRRPMALPGPPSWYVLACPGNATSKKKVCHILRSGSPLTKSGSCVDLSVSRNMEGGTGLAAVADIDAVAVSSKSMSRWRDYTDAVRSSPASPVLRGSRAPATWKKGLLRSQELRGGM